MFADDAKVSRAIISQQEITTLQDDLDKIEGWANTWQIGFNVGKCKVMHLGAKNMYASYMLGGESRLKKI